jgi:hypothetical protein
MRNEQRIRVKILSDLERLPFRGCDLAEHLTCTSYNNTDINILCFIHHS